jgi:hypothetical protein
MAYSPNLSNQSSCTLRRLAWALQKPMTKALEEVIVFLPQIIDIEIVCKSCMDKSKCNQCGFHSNHTNTNRNRTKR